MKTLTRRSLVLLAALVAGSIAIRHLHAVSTVFWRSATYQEFARGHLEGVSLSRAGEISVAPALRPVFHSGQALIWTATADARGNVYLATGNRGRIYRLTPAMLAAPSPVTPAKALLFSAPDPEVFALAVGPDGNLYAGTSPDGKVYRITPSGQSSVYFDPHSRYIWALAFSGSTLYVGTGEQGIIYRVTSAGHGSRFVDTRERQIMSLAAAPNGDLLAGTEPGGMIFRIRPDGQAFVMYRSNLEEIHRLEVAENGSIYVTAQGGGPLPVSHPAAVAAQSNLPRATAKISVTVQGSSDTGVAGLEKQQQAAAATSSATAAGQDASSASLPDGNGMASAIYRIDPDGDVETLWQSKKSNADDVLPSSRGLLFATDQDGAIYRLGSNRSTAILVQTRQEETTRLLRAGDRILATTRNLGNLYELSRGPARNGTFVSDVHDAGGISRWGDISWVASLPPGAGLALYTRSGNSPHPDFTWSPWSSAYSTGGTRVSSPAARYIQWKAVLRSASAASPVLTEVVIPYLPANRAPRISDFTATGESNTSGAVSYMTGPNGSVIPAPVAQSPVGRMIHLNWGAEDPDKDALSYDLYFQAQGVTGWKILRRDLRQTDFNIDSAMLPDGSYRFRLVASDSDANPPGMGKSAEMISAPVTLDTTPPIVTPGAASAPARGVAVAHFSATDQISPLQRAEFAVDGRNWRYLLSDNGIIDSRHEAFTVRAAHLEPGEHLLMLRVFDESGNSSSAKVMVTVK